MLGQSRSSCSAVRVCVALSVVFMVGFELCILYNGDHLNADDTSTPGAGAAAPTTDDSYDYSFVGSSWVYLGLNMLLVTLAISNLNAVPEKVSVRRLIKAYLRNTGAKDEEEGKASASEAKEPEPAAATAPGSGPGAAAPSLSDGPGRSVAILAAATANRFRRAMLYYVLSVIVLVVYAILNRVLADNDVDSGR